MTFLSQITERENHFLATVKKMQNNQAPIVLVGAGCLAQMTLDFMQRESLPVELIAINRAWLTSETHLNQRPVIALEDIAAQSGKVNYIVAMQYVSDELKALLASNASEVLIYDPSFIGVNTAGWLSYDYCANHAEAFETLYQQLNDQRSRDTLVAFINQRISTRHLAYGEQFEPVHYFPADLIRFGQDEVFIDCGAYNGDSIAAFLAALKAQGFDQPQRVIGFEPDSVNFALLEQSTASLPQCQNLKKGVWSSDTTLWFSAGKDQSSRVSSDSSPESESIELASIDSVLNGDNVTFIKMDVEGAELEALRGACETIRQHKPVLAISVYHKPEDLITIPAYLKTLVPEYQFSLRAHHPLHAFELVLYAQLA